MIWNRLPMAGFTSMHASYLLSLRGSMGVAQTYLGESPATAIREGSAAVARVAEVYSRSLGSAAKGLAVRAWQMGQADAGSPTLTDTPADDAAALVANLAGRDAVAAQQIIRRQALQYDVLRRRGLSHTTALLDVSGEIGDNVFKQLDRAQRNYDSRHFVEMALRQNLALSYLDGFRSAAASQGKDICRVLQPGEPDLVASLSEAPDVLAELFHPNTRCELRLEP
jgi:hypothetical protein